MRYTLCAFLVLLLGCAVSKPGLRTLGNISPAKLPTNYYNDKGQKVTKTDWLAEKQKSVRIVGYSNVEIDKEDVEIFARFEGLDRGQAINPDLYELGVTGAESNATHISKGYMRYHKLFKTKAACLSAYTNAAAVIKAGKKLP